MSTSVSAERLERNLANAQHSTGPKTEAGKRKSSLNALRHGLTSNLVVLPSENPEDYDEHLQSFIGEYRPQGSTESHLVQVLADTAWRQIRVTSLEADLLMFSPRTFEDFESQAKALCNLSLHSQRLSRQFERTVTQLRTLQKARPAKEEKDLEKLVNIVERHESTGKTYDPSSGGFAFSQTQNNEAIHTRNRERLAGKAYV